MTKKILSRFFLSTGLFLLAMLFAWEVFSEELTVVEIRRNIPLSDTDPVYRDFYINAGTSNGLKQHLVVNALRKVPIRDATGTQNYGEAMITVGQLKVIFIGDKFAIAREYKSLSRDDQPMLEQTAIMIGDKIELKASFVDNHKLPAKKLAEEKPAEARAPAENNLGPAEPAKPDDKQTQNTDQKADPKLAKNPESKVDDKAKAEPKSEQKNEVKNEAKKADSKPDSKSPEPAPTAAKDSKPEPATQTAANGSSAQPASAVPDSTQPAKATHLE